MKSLAPSEAAPALINWRRCAEHHQQRSKAYEEQIAKLYAAVNEQNEIIKKLGMSKTSFYFRWLEYSINEIGKTA